MRGPLPVYVDDPVARLRVVTRGDGRAEGVQAGARRRGDRRRCSDFAPPTILAQASRLQLLDAAVQPDRHERARARSSRSTCSGASCRTSSRSRSCPRTTRWRSRSCPTTAARLRAARRLRRDARHRDDRRRDRGRRSRSSRARRERRRRARPARAPAATARRPRGPAAARPPRRRPATPRRRGRPRAAGCDGRGRGGDGPQLLPSGPTARAEGPGASMRKRARRRPPSRNGGGAG